MTVLPGYKPLVRRSTLLSGLVALAGGTAGFVALRSPARAVAPSAPSCGSCSAPLYARSVPTDAVAMQTEPGLEGCLDEIEITGAGPYQLVATQDGRIVTDWTLTADTFPVSGHRFAPLDAIPAAGNEELQIRDDEGFVLARAYLHVPRAIAGGAANSASFAPNPIVQSPVVPTIGAARMTESEATKPRATLPESVVPLSRVQPANKLRMEGRTLFEMPLEPAADGGPPRAGLKVYLTEPPGYKLHPAIGKKCPPKRDGQECSTLVGVGPVKVDCSSTNAPMGPVSNSSISGGAFGMSGTLAWKDTPYKRVEYGNIYACVNGRLTYVKSSKCVALGGRAWSFSPSLLNGNDVGGLIGFDPYGWKWGPPTCVFSR